MSSTWKEYTIQDHLNTIYDQLISKNDRLKKELYKSRVYYNNICNSHIESGFQQEAEWMDATRKHQRKFLEYDTYCFLIDMISNYRNIDGTFLAYQEMLLAVEENMLAFAREEKYEVSAILKEWLTKFSIST